MVRKTERLCPLQVCVTRNQRAAMAIRLPPQRHLQSAQIRIEFIKTTTKPESEIGPDLIIATATGMELFADWSQQGNQTAFDSEMHILIRQSRLKNAAFRFTTDRL
jgi:hypothetical protein